MQTSFEFIIPSHIQTSGTDKAAYDATKPKPQESQPGVNFLGQSAAELSIGDRVVLWNLKTRSDLNGKDGEVTSRDVSRGRYGIRIIPSGEVVSVARINLFDPLPEKVIFVGQEAHIYHPGSPYHLAPVRISGGDPSGDPFWEIEGHTADGRAIKMSKLPGFRLIVPPPSPSYKDRNGKDARGEENEFRSFSPPPLPKHSSQLMCKMIDPGQRGILFNAHDLSVPLAVRDFAVEDLPWSPQQDGDGKARMWGLSLVAIPSLRFSKPYIATLSARSIQLASGAMGTHYSDESGGSPEEQAAKKLAAYKLEAIKHFRRAKKAQDSPLRKTLVLSVELVGVSPPVTRLLRVSSRLALHTFEDKVLCTAMGWGRSYHGYYFTDTRDGSLFGDTRSEKRLDAELFQKYHGYHYVNDEKVKLGDLLRYKGDQIEYLHDLGVRWEHRITVESVESEDDHATSTAMAHQVFVGSICLAGEGACPPEDGNGCDDDHTVQMATGIRPAPNGQVGALAMCMDSLYMERSGNEVYTASINSGILSQVSHPKYREKYGDALKSVNYKFAEHGMGKHYDPRLFLLEATNARIEEALRSDCSCAQCREFLARPRSARRKLSVCEMCLQAKSKLRACAKCDKVFYCDKECQLKHWPKHKSACFK